jgi:hypothetical protein
MEVTVKKLIGILAVAAFSLAVGAANAETKTPSGFREGNKAGWTKHRSHHHPPGWSEGEKTGWGSSKKPPGLQR